MKIFPDEQRLGRLKASLAHREEPRCREMPAHHSVADSRKANPNRIRDILATYPISVCQNLLHVASIHIWWTFATPQLVVCEKGST